MSPDAPPSTVCRRIVVGSAWHEESVGWSRSRTTARLRTFRARRMPTSTVRTDGVPTRPSEFVSPATSRLSLPFPLSSLTPPLPMCAHTGSLPVYPVSRPCFPCYSANPHSCCPVPSGPARLRKEQGANEVGNSLARERPIFGHSLVRKRQKTAHSLEQRPKFGHNSCHANETRSGHDFVGDR